MEHPNYTYNLDQQTAGVHPGSSSPWRHLAHAEETFSWGGGGCVTGSASSQRQRHLQLIIALLIPFLWIYSFIFCKKFSCDQNQLSSDKNSQFALIYTSVLDPKLLVTSYMSGFHIPSMILVKVIPVLRIHISRNAQHKCRIRMQILPQFWLYK